MAARRTIRWTIAGLLALSCAGIALWAAAGQRAELSGVVLESAGTPIPNAAVTLSGMQTRTESTDSAGRFHFDQLPEGNYRLSVRKSGYRAAAQLLLLQAGESQSVRVTLEALVERDPVVASPATSLDSASEGASAALRPAPEPTAPAKRPDVQTAPTPSGAPKMAESGGGLMNKALGVSGTGSGAVGRVGHGVGGLGATGGGKGSGRALAPSRRTRATTRPFVPAAQPRPVGGDAVGSEEYENYGVNQWTRASEDALATFAVDVDTASYTIVRRKLREEVLPPKEAVRVEEIVNYFQYDYAPPVDDPFAVYLESAPSPFEKNLQILRVGLKGQVPQQGERKPMHLTFLVDTSGSMASSDKLTLVKRSLRFLVDNLDEGDTVALCTYAGSVREVLAPTGVEQRSQIHAAIEDLSAGGSTAMSSGLQLAYQLASRNRRDGAVNRVIVCSDGDANVGRTDHGDMLSSISHYAKQGITLSTLGFGMGNYKDTKMEQLANRGDGNYYYIDDFTEARRVFGEKLLGTLQVIARDVKIQVEFDPDAVKKYRLVGYENRDIADQDFRNDKVDAGEVGAGHEVTALFEVEVVDFTKDWATARVRWKRPFSDVSQTDGDREVAQEKAFPLVPSQRRVRFDATSPGFRRAVAAAAWAENLRQSPFVESWSMTAARALAERSLEQESAEELELMSLIDATANLMAAR